MTTNKREGWNWLVNATKWHYFVEGKTLCGKYLMLGHDLDYQHGKDDSPDNCAECRRRLAKRNAEAAKHA